MINDVSRAFTRWLGSYIATRSAYAFVAGRPSIISTTTINFKGVIQNASPKDLLVLDEGDRTTESVKIHTITQLLEKDVVSYKGGSWLIKNVAHRFIGNYHKAIAVKQGR